MKDCLYCQKPFEPQKPKAKFCSDKCRVYFNRQEKSDGGFIYCLRNPITNCVFYVGKTIVTIQKRVEGHLAEVKNKTGKKTDIIKEILEAGQEVIVEQVEFINGESFNEIEIKLAEREKYWIEFYSDQGDIANKMLNPNAPRKTNPIGVRFDENVLGELKEKGFADTAQGALNFLYKFYLENQGIKPPLIKLEIENQNTGGPNQERIEKIQELLLLPPKYLNAGKRKNLLAELEELKKNGNGKN